MDFKEYIKTRRVNDNIQGDFVKDARYDKKLPNVKTWAELRSHLWFRGAEHTIEAAHLVWSAYQAKLRRDQKRRLAP